MSLSYQLPDLLSLCQKFDLRTNKACRSATTASETWLLNLKSAEMMNHVLTPSERETLHSMKAGLLASVCFTTCDFTQLRFLTDCLTMFLFAAARLVQHARHRDQSGWQTREESPDSLENHELLQYLVPELDRFTKMASLTWRSHFVEAVHSYRCAQLRVINNTLDGVIPSIESYIALRRDLSGFPILFELAQVAEDRTFPPMDHDAADKFGKMKEYTAEIISCCLDVFAFNNDQAQGNAHNLIAILMTHKALSVQGALNLAGSMIKDMIHAFLATEKGLLDSLAPPLFDPSNNVSRYWKWIPCQSIATKSSLPSVSDPSCLEDLPKFIQTLKDCIVGAVNWAYETELYFGTKGEEVRSFGWIFLAPKKELERA